MEGKINSVCSPVGGGAIITSEVMFCWSGLISVMLSLAARDSPALLACVLASREQNSICWMRLRFPCHVYDVLVFYRLSEFA